MKTAWILFLSITAAVSVWGEASASTAVACEKSVSFAVTAAGGQPVAAIPSFAVHWIANEKHQRQYPQLCFAQAPDPRTRNYLVVFSTQQEGLAGLAPTVLKYINSTPVAEDSTLGAIYGQMWHFTSGQPAEAATTTLNLLHTETSTVLFVRAYNEQGATVSQLSLKDVSGWFRTKERLLGRVVGEIQTDTRPATSSPASLRASLPVYYVNCNVPVESLASQELAPASPAQAVPAVETATLELWSSPSGADVYVDGGFVGKTPSSVAVSPGEHSITMSKQNFSTWQRKLQVSDAKRRVAGYLEQKVVTLGSGLP